MTGIPWVLQYSSQMFWVWDIFTLKWSGVDSQHHTGQMYSHILLYFHTYIYISATSIPRRNCLCALSLKPPSTDLYLYSVIQPTKCHLSVQINNVCKVKVKRQEPLASLTVCTGSVQPKNWCPLRKDRFLTFTAHYALYGQQIEIQNCKRGTAL